MKTEPPTGSTLQFLNLQTGKLERVASLQRPSFYGLTVDPNGQALVYSQRDRTRHDIIVMMNFH
jgi:hypothetical protein